MATLPRPLSVLLCKPPRARTLVFSPSPTSGALADPILDVSGGPALARKASREPTIPTLRRIQTRARAFRRSSPTRNKTRLFTRTSTRDIDDPICRRFPISQGPCVPSASHPCAGRLSVAAGPWVLRRSQSSPGPFAHPGTFPSRLVPPNLHTISSLHRSCSWYLAFLGRWIWEFLRHVGIVRHAGSLTREGNGLSGSSV